MKNVANWPAGHVFQPEVSAVVNGRVQDVVSASVKKSLGDTLSGSDGIVATTGQLVIRTSDFDVTQRKITPWSNAAPRRGQSVKVLAGPEGFEQVFFQGVSDGSSGGVAEDTTLELVDRYAALEKEITWDPMLATMHPIDDGLAYRYVGLTPTYVTTSLLRECGFYATPRFRTGATVAVPMNGSMWAESGDVQTCSKIGAATSLPDFEKAPWGQATRSVTASYRPAPYNVSSSDPFEIQLLVGNGGTTGDAAVAAFWGNSPAYLRLRVRPDKTTTLDYSSDGTTAATVCQLSGAGFGTQTLVSARVDRSSGSVTLTASTGESAAGKMSWPSAFAGGFSRSTIVVNTSGPQIAGVQVGFMATPVTTFEANAKVTTAAFPYTLEAMPAIVRRTAGDMLKEQAAAEMAGFWINDDNVLVWKNRFELVSGEPVRTITSLEDILQLSWSEPSRTTTASIKVTGRRPITSVSNRATITVYQGSKGAIESGQTASEVMSSGDDEDWIRPNLIFNWLTASAPGLAGYQRGRRSWIGAVATSGAASGDSTEEWIQGSDMEIQKVDPQTFVWSWKAPSLTGDPSIEMRSRETDPAIFPQWRNVELPLLRAYGRTRWVDQMTTRAGEAGGLQEHSHEVGWWVQHFTGLAGIADALQRRILNPQPTLSGVPIVPDTRLEIGDIVTLLDTHVTGLDLRCLIEEIDWSAEVGSQTMTLTLRILTVNGVRATYEELERVWQDGRWSQIETEWNGANYSALETDPLRRSP